MRVGFIELGFDPITSTAMSFNDEPNSSGLSHSEKNSSYVPDNSPLIQRRDCDWQVVPNGTVEF